MGCLGCYCDYAILVQVPAGQDILIDGGPSPQAVSLALGEKMPFWDRTIDLIEHYDVLLPHRII